MKKTTSIIAFILLILIALQVTPVWADYLSETPEIQYQTGEAAIIGQKAAQLGSPTAIYEYVRNNYEYGLYHGAHSATINTFQGYRGNDVDLASLLMAMLRSQGVQTRYAVGTVRVQATKMMNWLGVQDPDLAAAIMRDQGIQNVSIDVSSTYIDFEHVWVEALVSYANYRGAGPDEAVDCSATPDACQWIALDPSFKQKAYGDQTIDIHDVLDFDYDRYYRAIENTDTEYMDKNPLEIYEEQILDYLKANHPGKTLEDVMGPGTIIKSEAGLLPAALPYEVVGTVERYESVAEHDAAAIKAWTKNVALTLKVESGGITLQVSGGTYSLVQIGTQRLTVDYEFGETDYLVVRLGGQVMRRPLQISGTIIPPIVVGTPLTITIDMDGPPGAEPGQEDTVINVVYDNCIVGGFYLIAAGGESSGWPQVHRAAKQLLAANDTYPIVNRPSDDEPFVDVNANGTYDDGIDTQLLYSYEALDALTGGLLYSAGMLYYTRLKEQFQRVSVLNHTISPISGFVGVVGTTHEVEYLDGLPFSIMPGGLLIDMKGIRINGNWRIDQTEQYSDKTFELMGHIASSLEHEIWHELTGYDAVSTVRGIQMALNNGASLLDLVKTDTVDTIPAAYETLGFANQAPSPFSRTEWSDVFDTQPVTWDATGDYTFHTFKSHVDHTTSSLRLSAYGYWSQNGLHSFVSSIDSLENQLEDMIAQYGSSACCVDVHTGCAQYNGVTLGYALDRTSDCYFSTYNSFSDGNFFRFFDQSQGFVPPDYEYRRSDTAASAHPTELVLSLRDNVYLSHYTPETAVRYEYTIPSLQTDTGFNRFTVYILRSRMKSSNNITAMSFAITNSTTGTAMGGYVEEGFGALNPADNTLGQLYDNERFTDVTLVSQTNNDRVITPSTVDPVSTVTGNMYHDETDLAIKGRGIDYAFTRTYNSESADNADTDLPISRGWTHSYNMRLEANDYGRYPNYPQSEAPENDNDIVSSVTYTNERGGEVNFLVDGEGGTWAVTQPKGVFDTLELNTPASGQHTLTFRNGTQYTFEGIDGADLHTEGQTARLMRIQDPFGNRLDFAYDANGRLEQVYDNLGIAGRNGLTLTYHADNRLNTISDWSGRTWTYGYTDGKLTSVTDPLTNNRTYTYQDGTHLLKELILPEDRSGQQVTTTFSYYENNRAFDYKNTLGHTETLDYDLFRKRTRVTDPRGFVREYNYDENGALVKLTEPDQGILRFDNNADGLRYQKIDALGYTTAYSYASDRSLTGAASDTGGNVSLERDPVGYDVHYDYGLFDQVTRVQDKNGNERFYTYYPTTVPGTGAVRGKLQMVEAMLGGVRTTLARYTYFDNGNLQQKIEYIDPAAPARQRITDYTYDANGLNLLQTVTTGATSGGTVTVDYTYDALGRKQTETLYRRTSATDPTLLSLTTTYAYDTLGRVTRITDPEGHITETLYDANGKVYQTRVHHKQPGDTFDIRTYTTRTYDAADRLVSQTDIYGNETHYEYDEMGNVIKVTDANNHITRYEYDAMGRRTAVIDANGHRTETVFDLAGRVVQTIDANGHAVTFAYDALGRKTKDTTALGYETQYQYDANGNLTHMTDANAAAGLQPVNAYSATGYNEYDAFNRLTKTVDALNGETTYTYDLMGNMTSITDAKGQTTTFVYDDLGRLIEVIDPIVESPTDRTVSFTYDQAGNVLTRTDRLGRTTHYTYDELNRRVLAEYLADAAIESYTYDAYGDLTAVANDAVTYSYTYDLKHRMTSKTDDRLGRSLSWVYDDVGNVIQKTDYQDEITYYQYDSTNRLIAERNPAYLQVSYHYDPAGRLLNRILSNRARTDYAYDDDNRLTGLTNVSAGDKLSQSQTYTHDRVGNILSVTDTAGTVSYTYDALYRLTAADYPGTTNDQAYSYDAVGNRLTHTTASGTRHYIYNNAGSRLNEVRQNSTGGPIVYRYTYDDAGNRIEKHDSGDALLQSCTYDQKNRITTLDSAAVVKAFAYDPNDYRIEKDDGTDTNRYLMEGEHYEAVYDGSNQIKSKFLRGVVVDEIVNGYYYDGAGNKTNYTFHHDHLQSVVGLSGHNGDAEQTITYGPFGEQIGTTGASANVLGYTGRELDSETGLYYYRARYYDPEIGRFLNEDPLGFEAGINFYAYCSNNPINFNDPDGMIRLPGVGAAKAYLKKNLDELAGPWNKVGGHHVYSKAGFKGHINYDWRKGFSISEDFMKEYGLKHGPMTQYQRKAFSELAASGRLNTMMEHTRIAVEALQKGGADEGMARSIVARSLNDLRLSKVTQPTHIPWSKDLSFGKNLKVLGLTAGLGLLDALDYSDPASAVAAITFDGGNIPNDQEEMFPLHYQWSMDYLGSGFGASGGYVLYPNKPNTNMMRRVYTK